MFNKEALGGEAFVNHFQDWDFLSALINRYAVNMCCHKIRMESWERSNVELVVAEIENRPISLHEWKAAIRKEELEWEIREAILKMWEKGYTTYYSGYGGISNGLQEVNFISVDPPSQDLLKSIWQLTDETGVLTWTYGPGRVSNSFPEYNSGEPVWLWAIHFLHIKGNAQKIKEHWDKIAGILPSLGSEQLTKECDYAEDFRRNHILIA